VTNLREAARAAFVYALPLIEVATTRQRGQSLGHQMGVFAHVRNLANHRHRAVTTPNNDTLYSTAQIDLYLPDDTHWSSHGHALAARLVLDWLAGTGAVRPASGAASARRSTEGAGG